MASETAKELYGESFDSTVEGMVSFSGSAEQTYKTGMKNEPAFDIAFIGAGQAGGRLAERFYMLGYNKVLAINTTERDLALLNIPREKKFLLSATSNGAGKDMEVGANAFSKNKEVIFDNFKKIIGNSIDMILVCVGAGGGSGGGSFDGLIELARNYKDVINNDKLMVGSILTMPKASEGALVKSNALKVLNSAIDIKLAPLIIIDNQRMYGQFPGASIRNFWSLCNNRITGLFHALNFLAGQDSAFSSFDKADLATVLKAGIVLLGMKEIDKFEETDLAKAVRDNLQESLLCEYEDYSSAKVACVATTGNENVLGSIPMEALDYALIGVGRMIGKEDALIHSGVYEVDSEKDVLKIYSAIGGLSSPKSVIDRLSK